MITIEGDELDIISYSLTIAPKAGPLIAEGSISGSEELLRKVKKAKYPKLILEDGRRSAYVASAATTECAG